MDLGQLAADGDLALGSSAASASSEAATRRGDSNATTVSGEPNTRLQLAALARQEADEPPVVGGQRAGDQCAQRGRRPGQHLHPEPGGHARAHEHQPGVGDERHPGIGHERDDRAVLHPPTSSTARARSLCSW